MAWYKTGMVTATTGSTAITAIGTKFATNARVGDGFRGPDGEWYEVTNIASETVLGIYPPYQGPSIGGSTNYMIAPLQGYNKESADRLRALTDSIRDFSSDVEAAAQSALEAKVSEDAAKLSETNAKDSEILVQTSADNALASELAAKTSETNAKESETNADTAANDALFSQNAAATSAANALVSENNAKTSENAAKVSETNSKTSELAAKDSEVNAKTSETNSKDSETSADSDASSAANSATIATNAKTASETALTKAEKARDDAIAAAATVTGNLLDQGPWDASTGVYPTKPTVSSFWKVVGAGSATDAGETIEYGVGDTLMFSKPLENFYKIDNTESVTSVNGHTGVVVLTKGDVGLSLVDNTSDEDKPISIAQADEFATKIDKASIVNDFVTADTTKVLSANQGKELYDLIQANNNTLVVFEYVATLGQTVFTGADIHGKTMSFQPGNTTVVSQNGVQLQITVDYTTTGTGTVTLIKPVEQDGDVIQVQAFGSFSVANHYTKVEEDALLATKADKADTDTKFTDRYTKAESNAVYAPISTVARGFIDGLRMMYTGRNSLTVTAGCAYISSLGKPIELTVDKVLTGLTFTASTWHHVYLFDNAGVGDIEISTTVPVSGYGSSYYKTGGTTRRYVGSLMVKANAQLAAFRHDINTGSIIWMEGTPQSAPWALWNEVFPSTLILIAAASYSVAPRWTTTQLLATTVLSANSSINTSLPNQAVANTINTWNNIWQSATQIIIPTDFLVSRDPSSLGQFYVSGSNSQVTTYANGYTFER